MTAEILYCKFHQYGYCKFGLNCRKFHTRDTSPSPNCGNNACRLRHPKQCRFFVLNGKCKFAENCSFRHVSNEKIMKIAVEKELGVLKEKIMVLSSQENRIVALNRELEEIKADFESVTPPAQIGSVKFNCDFCDYKASSKTVLKCHHTMKHKYSEENNPGVPTAVDVPCGPYQGTCWVS